MGAMETTQPTAPAEALNRDGLWPMPPGPPHVEKHIAEHPLVRELIAGAARGLPLPFAIAIGLAALQAPGTTILAAGAIAALAAAAAAAVGRILAARAAAAHYAAERRREEEETIAYPDRERWEVAAILHRYGARGDALRLAVDAICADRRRWVDFMMRFELDLQEPEPQRAAAAAIISGGAQALSGLIPLLPWMILGTGGPAVLLSVAVTAGALFGCGWLEARGSGLAPLRGALQGLAIGGAAGAAAWLLAAAIGG